MRTNSATAAHDANDLTLGTVAWYSTPAISAGFISGLLTMYLMKYATDVLLIVPTAMGLIFGLSRVWDAVSDPLAGYLSDRTRSPFGRRRTWLLGAAAPLCVAFWALWNPPAQLEGPALTLWMAVAVFAFFTAYTAFLIPYKAFGAELSLQHHERTRLFGGAALTENVGSLLAAAAMFAIEASEDKRAAVGVITVGAGLVSVALIVLSAARLRERPAFQGRGARRPYSAFRDIMRNPHARPLFVVFFMEFLGFASLTAMLPYAAEYVLHVPKLTGLFIGTAIVTAIVTVPLAVVGSRRLGKKRVWMASLLIKAVFFAGTFLLGPGDWPILLGMLVFFGAAFGAGLVVGPSVKADVIDYDEYTTGERKEGSYFALWNLALKGGIAASLVLTGVVLDATGYRPNVEQTPTALLGIRLLCSGFPALFHLIAMAALWRFRFNEPEHAAVCAALSEREEHPPVLSAVAAAGR